jgi:hypothetical protein
MSAKETIMKVSFKSVALFLSLTLLSGAIANSKNDAYAQAPIDTEHASAVANPSPGEGVASQGDAAQEIQFRLWVRFATGWRSVTAPSSYDFCSRSARAYAGYEVRILRNGVSP